jgi:prepilin-type N-terminal cleavage/methylation domain-containing protein
MSSCRAPHLLKYGFTLIEVLITTVLVALISMTVFLTINNGITLWRVVHADIPEADIAIFFEKVTQEFENVFVCDGASFEGAAEWVKFPVSLRHLRRSGTWSMGALRYAYNSQSQMITRATYSLSDIYQSREPAPEIVFDHVLQASFAYYYNDSQENKDVWLDEWPPKVPDGVAAPRWPEAIKIRLRWEKSGKVLDNERIVPIPLAQK